ncbi:MAG: Aminomethyltransferase, partial [Planctomycetota bacterium]
MLNAAVSRDYDLLRHQAACLPWPTHSRLVVRGDDRVKFLNSYCTNDLTQLKPGQGCEAFIPNSQGKVLGFVHIYCETDRLLMETASGQAAPLIAHLDRYVLRSKVELIDETLATQTWLLAGPESTAILQRGTTSALPIDAIGSGIIDWHGHRIWVASTRLLSVPAWLISCAPDHAVSLQTTIDAQHVPTADAHAFESLRIESGTAFYGIDISADNLPQELGIDAQAISFRKGCYLGQETVARIDAMGHVNWHWTGFRFSSPDCPQPGIELTANDKPVARITS